VRSNLGLNLVTFILNTLYSILIEFTKYQVYNIYIYILGIIHNFYYIINITYEFNILCDQHHMHSLTVFTIKCFFNVISKLIL